MRKSLAGLVMVFLCAPFALAGQKQSASLAVAQLRQEYYAQDFSRVAEDGKPMLKRYPKALELRAWYVLAEPYGEDVADLVKQMKKAAPNSPWTLLASAVALGYQGKFEPKLKLCEKAIAGANGNSDVLVLATGILQRAASTQAFLEHPLSAGDLKAFIRKYKGKFKRSPEGLAAEAQALDTVARIERNTKSKAALKLAERVLKKDPTNVAVLLLKSGALLKQQEYQANYDLLKAAAQAVPDSYALHLAYWKAVLALPNGKPAEQSREIEADAARIISAIKPSTQIVQTDLRALHSVSPDLATAVGDLFLRQYPHTAVEDAVVFSRATVNEVVTNDQRDLEVVALESFIDRAKHYDANLLRLANSLLVSDLTQQEKPDVHRLYQAEVALESSPYGPPVAGIVTLADHKSHLPEMEKLARSQLDAQWTKLQKNVKNTPESQLKNRVRSFVQYTAGSWLDALGWVELQEGKLDAALPRLEDASKLSPKDPQIAIHLGRAYEAKGDNAKAEKIFRDAFAMPYYGEGDHPAIAALRQFYIHTHGGAKGLEAYMQPILAKDAARRHKAILAERLNPKKSIKSFELAALGGKEVGSDRLKGKYLILNFWATW